MGLRDLVPAAVRLPRPSALWLLVPGLLLLWAAFGADRAGWRQLRPGEATLLMQAESLLQDGDLAYERLDFERHVVTRYGPPPDLALASGTGGRMLTYDASFVPAVLFAAGLRLFGENGFIVVNALLLLASLYASLRLLRRRLGQSAAPWLAVLVFGSFAFASVFRATADALLFSATLLAAALVAGAELPESPAPIRPRRWFIAGALLSLAPFARWHHVLLAVPFFLGVPSGDAACRRAARAGLAIGLLAGFGAQSLVLFWAGGGLGLVDTVRFVFTPASGYPLVEVPTEDWARTVERLGALYFIGAPTFSWGLQPDLVAQNGFYFFAGRHIGLLTYAAAPLLLLAFGAARQVATGLLAAGGVLVALVLLLEPFDLAAGGAAGNPLVLPLLASTALAWRPRFAGRAAHLAAAAALLFAAPLLFELWRAPSAPPVVEGWAGQVPNHASVLARELLPYELSQQTLPGRDYDHAGLRVRLLSASLREQRLDVLALDGSRKAHLWVASPQPLGALSLHFGETAPATIELLDNRAQLLDRVLRADGGVSFRARFPYRRHRMWWSPRPQWLYRVDFRLPGAGDERLEWQLSAEPGAAP